MTVSSSSSRSSYTGNSAVSNYAYSFPIRVNTDLVVMVRNPTTGVETTLTLTTDYTVNGVGLAAGSTIDLVNASQAWLTAGKLTSGLILVIRRVRPETQLTDLRNQGSYFPETIEDALDHITYILQYLQDQADRSLKLPFTIPVSGLSPLLPTLSNPLYVVRLNAAGTGFEYGIMSSVTPRITGSIASPTSSDNGRRGK